MLLRIALCLRYDGSAYHGWQTQVALATVQATVEAAIAFVANHPVRVFCAGRTDTGVHATAQVIHFDTSAIRDQRAWTVGVNSKLPQDISVVWAQAVSHDFHARFKAVRRRYHYVVYNDTMPPAVLRNAVGWWRRPLDEHKMHRSAQFLLGEHDFSAFRGAGCQAHHPVREIYRLAVKRVNRMIIVEIQANAFLLHMVRNILGVLLRVGSGDERPEWVQQVLLSRDRRCAGVTFAAAGLYLTAVEYPATFNLPVVSSVPFFLP